jgi:hypothetical protein
MSGILKDLDALESRIQQPEFRRNKGLSNEIANYVFQYQPKEELFIREKIPEIVSRIEKAALGFHIVVFDLYETMIKLLKDEGNLDECFRMEEEDGFSDLQTNIENYLSITEGSEASPLLFHIKKNTPPKAVVFLIGIGKCYPFIRSHTILDNLNLTQLNIPVVLFFPGSYNARQFVLFSPGAPIEPQNYYRAFPINPDSNKKAEN